MSRTSSVIALAFVFLSLSLGSAHAQAPAATGDPAKLADIRKLLRLTGAASLGEQVMVQLMAQFRATMPSVPDKFWKDFQRDAHPEELVEMTVPIYDKHLTHDEIKQLIKFYESPVGKKLVTVMPQITQESMVVGREWGRKIGEQVARRLQEQKSSTAK